MKRERERRPVRPFSPARVIAASFLGVILVGTVLLMLPVSSKIGEMLHPLTALFTATSATCVTGLTLVDPYTQFTFFGQAVLLTMIEIGGIGLLTLTNFFMFSLRKKARPAHAAFGAGKYKRRLLSQYSLPFCKSLWRRRC
ncbi:MAG: potassium transporter TrkG [Acutalibacteraceae bacterium]